MNLMKLAMNTNSIASSMPKKQLPGFHYLSSLLHTYVMSLLKNPVVS